MSTRLQSHFFWGPYAPLSVLTGAGLIVMASARLAHAILCAGGIIWSFLLTVLVFYSCKKIMPQKGKYFILLFISALVTSLYILLAGFLNPLLIAGTWFFLVLIPPYCTGSGFFRDLESEALPAILTAAGLEALCLGLIIIAVSLIREPLGMGSLSLPGGVWGVHEIFSSDGDGFIPVRIFSTAAGCFLILGFAVVLFRRMRNSGSGEKS